MMPQKGSGKELLKSCKTSAERVLAVNFHSESLLALRQTKK